MRRTCDRFTLVSGGDGLAEVHVRVLILSAFDDRDLVLSAIEAGARGYILKDRQAAHLAEAVRLVVGGQFVVDPELVGQRAPRRAG